MKDRTVLIDAGLAVLAAVLVLILAPGLAIVALIAILVLLAGAVRFVLLARRHRSRGKRPARRSPPAARRGSPRR